MIGIITGIMAIPALIARPFVGRTVDRRGRKLSILVGFSINCIASVGYALFDSTPLIFLTRFLHGLAFATYYPGISTLVSDITPSSRRTEAFSYFSMFLFAGTALGPAIGEHLYVIRSAQSAFVASAILGAVGLLLATRLRDVPFRPTEKIQRAPLLHPAALFPAVILAFVAFPFGGTQAFVPLYVDSFGAGDSRLYFTTVALTIMVMRLFVGRVADVYGRGAVIIPGTVLCSISMLVLAAGADAATLVAAAIIFGLGWGALFPGLFALTIDRVPAWQRGAATATFTAAFDLTFGGGQILLGSLLQATSFSTIFVVGGISAACGMLFFVFGRKRSEAAFPPFTYPADDAASASS